jgi:uncharacterized membrane protein YphA (DoxX/SURF4 family)
MEQFLTPEALAGLLARVFTGILFFFQGYDKVFRMGVKNEIIAISPAYQKIGLPDIIVRFSAYLTSYLELIAGALLILGLFKYPVLYALSLDLLVAAAGMSILNPLWDLRHVFPRLLLILFLLIYSSSLDIISLDHFMF